MEEAAEACILYTLHNCMQRTKYRPNVKKKNTRIEKWEKKKGSSQKTTNKTKKTKQKQMHYN